MQPEQKSSKKHNKYTVSVRIRPPLTNSSQVVFNACAGNKVKEFKTRSIITYSFDEVFEPDHNNEYIYKNSVESIVEHFVLRKINTTFLAYGQTGSGKTHTLFGEKNLNKMGREQGLTQYILGRVVQQYLGKKDIICSFMQIYKEKVTDLLSNKSLTLRENANNELIISQKTVVKVTSIDQIIQTLHKANTNKIFGNSYINSESSRSHVIFTIEVGNSQLNIVDLCGNEVLTYKFSEKQREETNSINLSLFTLNAVINDLCQARSKHIPFRNSVLTRILKPSLIQETKTQIYLFCNIAPEQQHQEYSSSTLRFGQIAIAIDEDGSVEEKVVNLSQQKRDMKKVDNIVEMTPKQNGSFDGKPKWEQQKVPLLKQKVILYKIKRQNANLNILFLHAYGYGCCGDDWDYFVPYITKQMNVNIYSVDFPGFGNSTGKKFTSRAENFHEKGEPLQFMKELFRTFGFSSQNKVLLVGYDLGGAIALSCAMNDYLKKSIAGVSVFHPTWTDKLERLAVINLPVQLIWVPVETFHLVSAGTKMSKIIKNSTLYKLNIGPYTQEKASGYYTLFSREIGELIRNFMLNLKPAQEMLKKGKRGKIEEEEIIIDVNKEEEELLIKQEAIKRFYQLLENGQWREVFDAIIKGGEKKPKYVRLASELPIINPEISLEQLLQVKLFIHSPLHQQSLSKLPLLPGGRQVHIKTKINLSVLQGQNNYLVYDEKNGEVGITHHAVICAGQKQEEIEEENQIEVEVKGRNNARCRIKVPLNQVVELNSETLFRTDGLGGLVFEDNVTCKYNSLITKLMLVRCCHSIQSIVGKLNLSQNTEETLKMQQECAERIFKTMDLRHLVHEGIENVRFTGTDVGRLAYFGQGNCHHLASVLAALLLPFGKILGWDVIFRAGSFFQTGRQIDEQGQPLKKWNGKPNTKVEDHTWLEVVFKPSFKVYVFDPSFAICNMPIDQVYTFEGKMHISGKNQCSSYAALIPSKIHQRLK